MPQTMETFTLKLKGRENLSREEAGMAAKLLAEEGVEETAKLDFLKALGDKGETAQEVAAFAATFRELARDPQLGDFAPLAIDVCGTGGDGAGTFNISTAVAFVLAAAGVPVIKHGNRSITSKCGSADLLEALGIPLRADGDTLRRWLERCNFAFLFAPDYHPAFKHIAPVRKALAAQGRRSVFNILGPLLNPARPAFQLLGVYAEDWVPKMAGALGELGLRRGVVVHSECKGGGGFDELSCAGRNVLCSAGDEWGMGYGGGTGMGMLINPEELGLGMCAFEDLRGGDVQENVRLLNELAAGKAPRGLTDTVALNAGLALWVAGKAEANKAGMKVKDRQTADMKVGVAKVLDVIEGGQLAAWLRQVRELAAL